MPERAWTLRSISSCQISSVNIVPGVKIQRSLFQQLYIECYPCVGHRVRGQEERWINEMNKHDRHPQRLKVYWGDSWSQISSVRLVIAPIPSWTCLLKALIPRDRFSRTSGIPEISSWANPYSGNLIFFSQHWTHREFWESVFLAVFAVSFTIFAACHRSHYVCLSI